MKATEMNAMDRGRKVRIFVSPRMKNDDHDYDERDYWGWWYSVVGGEVGYFVVKRPTSGCSLQGLDEYERGIFNTNERMNTKEDFARIVEIK